MGRSDHENNRPCNPEIKEWAKRCGLVTNKDVRDVYSARQAIRKFCQTLQKLELRDEEKNWSFPEETAIQREGLEEYLKKVRKSRKKPKR